MILIVILLSVFAFFKTIGYAIYEFKDNSNKIAGIIIRASFFGKLDWTSSYNNN